MDGQRNCTRALFDCRRRWFYSRPTGFTIPTAPLGGLGGWKAADLNRDWPTNLLVSLRRIYLDVIFSAVDDRLNFTRQIEIDDLGFIGALDDGLETRCRGIGVAQGQHGNATL